MKLGSTQARRLDFVSGVNEKDRNQILTEFADIAIANRLAL